MNNKWVKQQDLGRSAVQIPRSLQSYVRNIVHVLRLNGCQSWRQVWHGELVLKGWLLVGIKMERKTVQTDGTAKLKDGSDDNLWIFFDDQRMVVTCVFTYLTSATTLRSELQSLKTLVTTVQNTKNRNSRHTISSLFFFMFSVYCFIVRSSPHWLA